ncbi:hypothetical protein BSU00_10355 [Tenacibaculum sp. SG-28]|nr:hypothetical protein BSU00_10355 [Tenacibaculum sp. SG-28]
MHKEAWNRKKSNVKSTYKLHPKEKFYLKKSSTKNKKEKGYNITTKLRITPQGISYKIRMCTIVYFEKIHP